MDYLKLLPQTPFRWLVAIGLPIMAALFIAEIRWRWGVYAVQFRGPSVPFDEPMMALCGAELIGLMSLFVLLFFSVLISRSPLPVVIMIIGVYAALQRPLPPEPDTPEKIFFLAHRAEYEALVDLVASNDLDSCHGFGPNRDDLLELPKAYIHLSGKSCVQIPAYAPEGLNIRFFPFESFYHHLAYTESGNLDEFCNGDPHVEQKIDDHWFVCEYEWN